MRKITLLLFIVNLILCQSCIDDQEQLTIVNLEREISINQLSDSSYFSDIRSLYYMNGKCYASDYNRDQIFILDDNLELQKIVGQKGKGPGELLGASGLYVQNDTVFLYNSKKRVFELFSSEGYLQTIDLLPQHRVSSDMRFAAYKGELYFSSFNSPFSIAKYNYRLDSSDFFGCSKEYRSPNESRIKNDRHIHVFQDRIIAIPDCQPFIELYTLEGEYISRVDLSNIGPVKKMLDYIEKSNYAENSYFQFFSESYVYKKDIFILVTSVDEKAEKYTNTLLQLELENDVIEPIRLLNLGNGWFNSFCVLDNKIIAVNGSTGELVRYAY